MSALPLDVPVRSPRPRHLELVGPGFVPVARSSAAPVAAPAVVRPAAPAAPVRLTARGRRVLAAAVLVVASALSVGAGAAVGSALAEPAPVAAESVVVSPGDTLWAIAAGVAAPGEDVRDVVAAITELNGLETATVTVGQELVLPA